MKKRFKLAESDNLQLESGQNKDMRHPEVFNNLIPEGSHKDSSDSKNRCPQKDGNCNPPQPSLFREGEKFLPYLGLCRAKQSGEFFARGRMGNVDQKIGGLEGKKISFLRKLFSLQWGGLISFVRNTIKPLSPYSPIALSTSTKKAAFTLAEVLITLAIIGVVAAMTLPSVIQNQQKRSLEVATKKFYTTMSQAVKQYMADEGVDDLRNTPLASDNYEDEDSAEAQKSINDFVTKYFKIVKKCEPGHIEECFYDGKYKMWGESENYPDGMSILNNYTKNYNSYVLANGMSLAMGYYSRPIEIYVDVNGKKGPNRVGYDLWTMDIFYDGSIDESEVYAREERTNKKDIYGDYIGEENVSAQREARFDRCKRWSYGGCFGHFLENGFKFDY